MGVDMEVPLIRKYWGELQTATTRSGYSLAQDESCDSTLMMSFPGAQISGF
jgi:hypothetical protein